MMRKIDRRIRAAALRKAREHNGLALEPLIPAA
jgi:hypothetical protein